MLIEEPFELQPQLQKGTPKLLSNARQVELIPRAPGRVRARPQMQLICVLSAESCLDLTVMFAGVSPEIH